MCSYTTGVCECRICYINSFKKLPLTLIPNNEKCLAHQKANCLLVTSSQIFPQQETTHDYVAQVASYVCACSNGLQSSVHSITHFIYSICDTCTNTFSKCKWIMSTVRLEILARRYFGGLLKICHLAEFTLAVEPVSSHNDFITKWLIERTGN